MKRFVTTLVGLALIGSLVGFSSNASTNNAAPKPKVKKGVDAADVVNAFKKDSLPIGDQLVYTVENDPDKLMGRPGQYTSKVNFVDTTEQENMKVEILHGGTVEVFDNNVDAKNRFNYISKIAKSSPVFDEYDFVQGKILLRLSKNLPSNHAKKYEDTLKKIAQ
jgi:hypothetical protein